MWAWQLPPDGWAEPLEYALGLLLLTPGARLIMCAIEQRVVIELSECELTVMCGMAFFERAVARLPLDTLEVQVAADVTRGVRYDAHAVSTRLLAALSPISGPSLPETDVKVYLLQVRNKPPSSKHYGGPPKPCEGGGQEQWLALLGSQLASEIENARLVVAAAAIAADKGRFAEVETVNERE